MNRNIELGPLRSQLTSVHRMLNQQQGGKVVEIAPQILNTNILIAVLALLREKKFKLESYDTVNTFYDSDSVALRHLLGRWHKKKKRKIRQEFQGRYATVYSYRSSKSHRRVDIVVLSHTLLSTLEDRTFSNYYA